jgi:hypothetical protein
VLAVHVRLARANHVDELVNVQLHAPVHEHTA